MITSARQDSLTVDEKVHISAGYLHVFKGDYTFNNEHPPLLNDLAGLFAKLARPNLPARSLATFKGSDQWEFGDLFFYDSGNNVDKIIFYSRLPFILLTLALIYLVFIWAKEVFGPKAGLMAAILVGFCPNILAHGRLATTDMGLTFFFILALWLLRKYLLKPSWQNSLILGLGIFLAVGSKFSGIFIFPVIFLGLIFTWLTRKRTLAQFFGEFFLMLAVAIVLFWGLYFFSTRAYLVNLPASYQLSSLLGSHVISSGFLKVILIPIDKFFQGYEILANHNSVGHWAFLNGQTDYRGWWYYFPLTLIYKLTVPALILIGLAIIISIKIHKKFLEEFLVIFPLVLFLGISLTSKIDIGIRHILPVVVLLFIFTSRLAEVKNFVLKPIIAGLLILHIVAGFLAYPNFIAYFNQIAGGESGGSKHLADSNLDWNQNIKRFAKYARENNIDKISELCWDQTSFEYYGIQSEILPNSPTRSVVAICVQQLLVPPAGFDFSWVTNPPTGGPPDIVIGNTIYVWRYDLKSP